VTGADPRKNAPATISSLPFEERRLAIIARGKARTDAYMAPYREEARPTLIERMIARVRG
jgi:hypothetical protein